MVSYRKESHPLYSHKKLMDLCGSFKVVYLLDMDTQKDKTLGWSFINWMLRYIFERRFLTCERNLSYYRITVKYLIDDQMSTWCLCSWRFLAVLPPWLLLLSLYSLPWALRNQGDHRLRLTLRSCSRTWHEVQKSDCVKQAPRPSCSVLSTVLCLHL